MEAAPAVRAGAAVRPDGDAPLLDELARREADGDLAAAAFDHAWYASILDEIRVRDPRYAAERGGALDEIADDFRHRDVEHLAGNRSRVRRTWAEMTRDAEDRHPLQARVIRKQAALRRGHLPLRRLLDQAADVLFAVKPCWAMSPLMVSQVLPAARPFDVVIFDEASQIVPADAIPSVELVLEHASSRPQESLGVIALGVRHAERIDLALRSALESVEPDVEVFFADEAAEPFFVKNLERVQGDERDAIILSIGYGKHPDGRMRYQWGPLLRDGGERRRRRDPDGRHRGRDRQPVRGVGALAAGGVRHHRGPAVRRRRLPRRLRRRAPRRPVPVILAVEADGASYRDSGSVRDRDRLRMEHLERLGWRFHRLWSTNWFHDPDAEVAKLREAFDQAVAQSPPAEPPPGPEPGPDAEPAPGPDREPAISPEHPAPTGSAVMIRPSSPPDTRLPPRAGCARYS